jgi:hypothetical protein
MTHREFTHMLNSLGGLSREQIQQLRRELESQRVALPAVLQNDDDPILGMWRDDAELIDQIVDDAMRNRREQPWRLAPSE